jgi:hypothetical protein
MILGEKSRLRSKPQAKANRRRKLALSPAFANQHCSVPFSGTRRVNCPMLWATSWAALERFRVANQTVSRLGTVEDPALV